MGKACHTHSELLLSVSLCMLLVTGLLTGEGLSCSHSELLVSVSLCMLLVTGLFPGEGLSCS